MKPREYQKIAMDRRMVIPPRVVVSCVVVVSRPK